MKVIAKVSEDNYLVEVYAGELSQICGQQIDGQYTRGKYVGVGSTIDVNQAWKDLQAFRAAHGRIQSAAETLRACASLVDTASAAYLIAPEPEEDAPNE